MEDIRLRVYPKIFLLFSMYKLGNKILYIKNIFFIKASEPKMQEDLTLKGYKPCFQTAKPCQNKYKLVL